MLALKNLARRKVRTSLTVAGVAAGVASVVALVAVSRSMRGQFDDLFAAGDAHLVLTRKGASDPLISYLPDTLAPEIAALENVRAVHPIVFGSTQIPEYPFFFTYGVTEGSPFLANVTVVAGAPLFAAENAPLRILLGSLAAEHLHLEVGSRIQLLEDEYEVVGIFESAIPFLAMGGMLPFADAQREAGQEGKMTSAMLELTDFDPERIGEEERAIETAFPVVEATPPARFTDAFDEFDLVEEAVTVLSLLAVLVGGIGVMNTMLMSVFERTREIGVLQAIGWSKGMVLRQILAEAALVCLLGGPVGIALGVAGVELVGTIGRFAWLSGEYGPALFAQAMAVGVAMGLVGAAYPALRAVRVTPIEALRYE